MRTVIIKSDPKTEFGTILRVIDSAKKEGLTGKLSSKPGRRQSLELCHIASSLRTRFRMTAIISPVI